MKRAFLTGLSVIALALAIAWAPDAGVASEKASPLIQKTVATQTVALIQMTASEEELVGMQFKETATNPVAQLVTNEGFTATMVLDTKVATNTISGPYALATPTTGIDVDTGNKLLGDANNVVSATPTANPSLVFSDGNSSGSVSNLGGFNLISTA